MPSSTKKKATEGAPSRTTVSYLRSIFLSPLATSFSSSAMGQCAKSGLRRNAAATRSCVHSAPSSPWRSSSPWSTSSLPFASGLFSLV